MNGLMREKITPIFDSSTSGLFLLFFRLNIFIFIIMDWNLLKKKARDPHLNANFWGQKCF